MARVARGLHHQRDYSPVHWSDYFDEAHDLSLTSNTIDNNLNHDSTTNSSKNSFRVYLKNFREPFAPSERAYRAEQLELSGSQLTEYSRWPTVVTLHGGGYSALTWSLFAHHLTQLCQCRVMSIDLRSHGDTRTENDDQMDAETLVNDILEITRAGHRLCGFPEPPKLVLVGHSMGGALAIKLASQEDLPIVGLVVIDVVEGTAKDALPLMLSVIKSRPTRFPSLTNAIEWSVRSGMAKCPDAARVSMPGNLVNLATGHLAIHDTKASAISSTPTDNPTLKRHVFPVKFDQLILASSNISGTSLYSSRLPPLSHSRISALKEEISQMSLQRPVHTSEVDSSSISDDPIDEESIQTDGLEVTTSTMDSEGYRKPPDLDKLTGYTWRTDLARTQPHWAGWFEGLSVQMLNANVQGKFLLLAGIDRLDKTLTIGQMQGKFMMKVLPKCGHAVHEDLPEQVASAIADFIIRNKFSVSTAND